MTTTLTQRYIDATIRSIPPATQEDVRAELEASITDAVEARIELGEAPMSAERAVLSELGDPAVLAAGFTDRPLHLIGPRYYLLWWRLLKLLLWIVPACVFVAVALGQALADAPLGTVIGQSIAISLGAVVHLCFWVTIVFVVMERTGAQTGVRWEIDQLPEPRETGTGRVDLVAGLLILALSAGAIMWDQFRGFVRIQDQSVSILHSSFWPWVMVLIVLQALFSIILYIRGRWNVPLAVTNTVLAVLFATLSLTALGREMLFSAQLLQNLQLVSALSPETLRILAVLLVFGVIGVSVWSIIDGWLKQRRSAS